MAADALGVAIAVAAGAAPRRAVGSGARGAAAAVVELARGVVRAATVVGLAVPRTVAVDVGLWGPTATTSPTPAASAAIAAVTRAARLPTLRSIARTVGRSVRFR